MKHSRLTRAAGPILALVILAPRSPAHDHHSDVYWHIDPSVETCSMVLDPSLTQSQWHRFTREAGAVLSFKSLAPATTLGKGRFDVGVDVSATPVDQHDLAWINTFVHPDEDCPLGDAVSIPTVRASMGVSDRVDAGAYWTTAPGANYGGVGAELKYAFVRESSSRPALAVRGSASLLTGVPDFDFGIYSVDLLSSKKVSRFTPYLGVKESRLIATETTRKVDLEKEAEWLTQGTAGVACSLWRVNLAAEYNVSTVNTFAMAIRTGR